MMTIICWIGAACSQCNAILVTASGKAAAFDMAVHWLSAVVFLGAAIWLGPYLDAEEKRIRKIKE